jgi:hypothetical protein
MGMVLGLTTLSDANIERVLSDPPLIWRIVAPDDPDVYEQARRAQAGTSLFRQLFGSKKPATPDADLTLSEGEGLDTDLDKSWHGIHYLLTGTSSGGDQPWAFLIHGGRPAGIEVGYGPARLFTSAETRSILEALEQLTVERLRSRFDPDDMTAKKIYPEIWSRGDPDEHTIGYLLEYFVILRGFLRQAVDAGAGIVVSLT